MAYVVFDILHDYRQGKLLNQLAASRYVKEINNTKKSMNRNILKLKINKVFAVGRKLKSMRGNF